MQLATLGEVDVNEVAVKNGGSITFISGRYNALSNVRQRRWEATTPARCTDTIMNVPKAEALAGAEGLAVVDAVPLGVADAVRKVGEGETDDDIVKLDD